MLAGSRGFAVLLFGPIGVVYIFFLLLPLSYFLALSVFEYSHLEMYIPTFTLENYARLVGEPYYQAMLLRTLRVALLTTVFCLLAGYALAYFLARYPTRWRGVLMFMVIAPLMSGVIVRTYAWIVILGREGAINQSALWLGLATEPFRFLQTEFAVVLALVHILLPFMVFPLFSSLAGQDPDLERAASTLGARPPRIFLEIALPLSRPGIVMGSVLVFTLAAGAVVTPSLLGGRKVETLGVSIYQATVGVLNWPLAAAMAVILVSCQLGIIFLYLRGSRSHAPAG